jgi:hypothetical protein
MADGVKKTPFPALAGKGVFFDLSPNNFMRL